MPTQIMQKMPHIRFNDNYRQCVDFCIRIKNSINRQKKAEKKSHIYLGFHLFLIVKWMSQWVERLKERAVSPAFSGTLSQVYTVKLNYLSR